MNVWEIEKTNIFRFPGPHQKPSPCVAARLVLPAALASIPGPTGQPAAEGHLQLLLLLQLRHGTGWEPGAGAIHARSSPQDHHHCLETKEVKTITNQKILVVLDFSLT